MAIQKFVNNDALVELLCKAAGQDPKHVKSISCHAPEPKAPVFFEVVLLGQEDLIGAAMEGQREAPKNPENMREVDRLLLWTHEEYLTAHEKNVLLRKVMIHNIAATGTARCFVVIDQSGKFLPAPKPDGGVYKVDVGELLDSVQGGGPGLG